MGSNDPRIQTVTLLAEAPQKPPSGEPCNGCGICCAAEPCPLSRLLLRRGSAPCIALEWDRAEGRYRCGLLQRPEHYLRWLPVPLAGVARRLAGRWIAAGSGCDSDARE